MQQRMLGPLHPDLATTLNNLAVLRMHVDDFSGSANYSRQAIAVWAAQGKPDHPFALISKAHLAAALRESGDLEQAERISREVLPRDGINSVRTIARWQAVSTISASCCACQGILMKRYLIKGSRMRCAGTLADVPPMEAAVANVQYALSESAAEMGWMRVSTWTPRHQGTRRNESI